MFSANKLNVYQLRKCLDRVVARSNALQRLPMQHFFANYVQNCSISTSGARNGLMEFFDDEKNWGAEEVKSGRSWKKEELRLKSNVDLHKLWYVLLKERNMLLTMEEEAKSQIKLFPSPERLDKVADSMENLEAVVRERNAAYHELETGENGEQPAKMETNCFGLQYLHKKVEHLIPKSQNAEFNLLNPPFDPNDKDVRNFLLKYNEKLYMEKKREKIRNFNHVAGLIKRFPNMDMEAVKQQYPDVDIEKAKQTKKARGHYIPK